MSLLHTATFRLAVVFAAAFGGGAALLLLVLDFGIARFAELEMEQALTHQMEVMRADADLEGGQALANILNEQARTTALQRYSYLVADANGALLVSGLPHKALDIQGFGVLDVDHQLTRDATRRGHGEIMVLTDRARDGSFMAVGRDTQPLQALRTHLHAIALWGGLGLLILAMAAGLLAGWLFLRRLEQVNASAARIMSGHPSERLPPIGFGREFETLAANLNRMLERQEATINALRQVSADIAHDLRTPLNRLRNRLEEAADMPPETHGSLIESAIAEADELLDIITSLLTLARIEGGGAKPDLAPVDAGAMAQALVQLYRPAAEESGHVLKINAEPETIISGDAILLNQLLSNLLDNALSHTPSGATIEVGVIHVGDRIRVTIADNGPGVPAEAREAIFRRFYRLDLSRTSPGAGLGLPLVAAIARLHDATLNVADNQPGLRLELLFPSSPVSEGYP